MTDLETEIKSMIDDFVDDPIRQYAIKGSGSSTKVLKTVVLDDGTIAEIQLKLTCFKKELFIFSEGEL